MRRALKLIGVGIVSLGLAASVFVCVATLRTKLPGEKITPAGIRRSTSRYVSMHDGVEIAVSVYLPQDLKTGERVPVLMRTTRYWREPKIGWIARMMVALHVVQADDLFDRQVLYFNQRHFAVLLVDARGSGASGGYRAMEFSPPRWRTWEKSRPGPRSSGGRTVASERLEFPTRGTLLKLQQFRISLRSAPLCRFTIMLIFCLPSRREA